MQARFRSLNQVGADNEFLQPTSVNLPHVILSEAKNLRSKPNRVLATEILSEAKNDRMKAEDVARTMTGFGRRMSSSV